MKLYIKGTRKWVKVRLRNYDGANYWGDLSKDILYNYQDGGDYTESEISKAIDYCAQHRDAFGFTMFVESGEE